METRPDNRWVLLTGGTAQVGLHVLPQLNAAGFKTVALSRKILPGKQPGEVEIEGIRWLHPDQFRQANAPIIDIPGLLISAGPISLAVDLLQCCQKIRRVVCLSTSSVLSKADSGNLAEREQIKGILEAEQQLLELCAARNLDLCILRPTMIYGCGMDENISRMAGFIRRFGFLPVAGQACGLRQPVHAADLAALLVRVCQSDFKGRASFVVAGGSTLSYREMAVEIFRAQGKPPRMPSLPAGLLAKLVGAMGLLGGLKGLNAAMVLRQNQDLVFDDREIRQQFGFQPRAFNPGPQDFILSTELRRYLPAA